jgi:glycine/D-amino acid oxidase-like deaminating enzyme
MPRPPSHVAILGGGVLGVSTATQLAERGVAVTLVTDGPLASGASGRSLSWLNSFAERSPAYHRLRMIGIDRYRTLAAGRPDAPWLRFDGGLFWGDDAGRIAAHHRAVGYEVRPAGAVPGVAAPPGAFVNPGEGWVDLPSLIRHLVERLRAAGGRAVADAGRARPVVDGGRVVGVQLGDASVFAADAVVVATGAAVPGMLAELGVPVAAQDSPAALVRTEPVATGLRMVVNAPRVALRPTPDGRLVLGAGWLDAELARVGSVPPDRVPELLAEASRVLEGRPALVAEAIMSGPRPMPVDDEPVLGGAGVEGLYVAFTHSGATLGLIAGELVSEEIVSGTPHPLLDPFRPGRFAQ